LDVAKFNAFMSHLLEKKAVDLYRTKGLLAFQDQGDNKYLFQGVHEQIDFGPSEIPWQSGEERISKMVFIGRNLDYEELQAGLLGTVADPATAVIKMHKRA
jgi:G3E family GTPase